MTASAGWSSPSTTHRALIVGAGPAGLAVGACLARLRVPALLLEQGDAVGRHPPG
ncbi:MAG: NAD(P)-binding protein [Gemmatimonadales bacterium]